MDIIGEDESLYAQIKKVRFGIWSFNQMVNNSVCEIFSSKLKGPNTVYDERMGTISGGIPCVTCHSNNMVCPGHFGHIVLSSPIVHPLYYPQVLLILKCVCFNCAALLVNEDLFKIEKKFRAFGEKRLKAIAEYCEGVTECYRCHEKKPNYFIPPKEIQIYQYFDDKKDKIRMKPIQIFQIFEMITRKDVKLMGFAFRNSKPKRMILRAFPVLPPCARPPITNGGEMCDDDLTYKYIEIIKVNEKLKDKNISAAKEHELITALEFHIKTLMDNKDEKARHTTGRPYKCIRQRLSGKHGLLRQNIMGKRVDFSARTVIGADPTLRLNEVAIPKHVAQILTFPERVYEKNIELMSKLLKEGKINRIIRNGSAMVVKYARKKKDKALRIGDVVERQLMDRAELEAMGKQPDWVLFNRQPTLHKMSMMGHIVRVIDTEKYRISEYKKSDPINAIREEKDILTFRMNLSSTSPYNADKSKHKSDSKLMIQL